MATYTPLLRFVEPANGDLGWGGTVNNGFTALADAAIAGTADINVTAGNATLTTANGATDEARRMVLNITGTPGVAREVLVPSTSKIYFVRNGADAAVTVKVSGQTGVSVPAGRSTVLRVNGTDVVDAVTQLSSLDLATNPTFSAGTANGVVYLNGSKAATSGTNLVFDGTNLGIGTSSPGVRVDASGQVRALEAGTGSGNGGLIGSTASADGNAGVLFQTNSASRWNLTTAGTAGANLRVYNYALGSTVATFDSSGNLGLGVTPSAWGAAYPGRIQGLGWAIATPLDGGTDTSAFATNAYNSAGSTWNYRNNAPAALYQQFSSTHRWYTAPSGTAGNAISFTQAMTLDASGNLGIGTSSPGQKLDVKGIVSFQATNSTNYWAVYTNTDNTFRWNYNGAGSDELTLDASGNLGLGVTPSAWGTGSSVKAVQLPGASLWGFASTNAYLSANAYYNGTNRVYVTNSFASEYSQASGVHAWFTAPSGTAGNAISFTQAMTLDASSNLTLKGNYIIDDTGTGIVSAQGTVGSALTLNGRGDIRFTTGGNPTSGATERARITSGGLFGINGTPPSDSQFYSKNSVSGTFAGTFENYDAGGYGISIGTASTVFAHFYPNAARTGSPVGSITTNGSSTSYVTSSDRRLKENIQPADDAGAVIDAIEVVQHDWKVGGHTRFGVIAQDLNAVAPEAVSEGDDGDEIERTWGVDYSKLVPMLIKEIQSLRARVAALEAKP